VDILFYFIILFIIIIIYLTALSVAQRMMGLLMNNWRVYGRKQSWAVLSNYPDICLEAQRNISRNLGQCKLSAGLDLSLRPPEHEVGLLTALPQLTVSVDNEGLTQKVYEYYRTLKIKELK
jgi:hypothetical protein